jgi:tight adherence protein C
LNPWYKGYLLGLGPILLFFLPNLAIRFRRRRRALQVRRHLPVAIDLLEVCVTAGMGLDTAWNAVSDEIRHVSMLLADEMMLVNLERQLGASRTLAMRNMAERTGAEELSSLVALLVQTERFGTSVGEALRTFAQSMREARSMRSEEAAEKLAVKLLFPLVFFIFPVMLLVMGGPAGITIYDVMIRK